MFLQKHFVDVDTELLWVHKITFFLKRSQANLLIVDRVKTHLLSSIVQSVMKEIFKRLRWH